MMDRRLGQDSLLLQLPEGKVQLDILVENLGRINFGPYLLKNRKGITDKVLFGGEELKGWEMYGLPFRNAPEIAAPGGRSKITGPPHVLPGSVDAPVIRSGSFNLTEVSDTYLDMRQWGKGVVWINGHNLGRYWSVGPQQTLYVPAEWLYKGRNEVVVLELLKTNMTTLSAIDKPILDTKTEGAFSPGKVWTDTDGEVINAHGGGALWSNGRYYWFGEKRGMHGSQGVNVYSSADLHQWKYEGEALTPSKDSSSDIAEGCVMERPKVIYNQKTGKYVLWFHLELKGQGYKAARAAVAVSDKITGPYRYVNSFRPNGNMSRDMTLFTDEDGSAYEIYSARENYDLRIVKLSDDYLSATGQDTLLFSRHREAPALFKVDDKYYLITSGCTGWAPNKASMHVSGSLWGPWKETGINPMRGPDADSTYGGQSTFVLPVQGKKDALIFVADRWNPQNLRDSRYLWLPVKLNEGLPYVEWKDQWKLD
jgi:beta-galactosidase